ncbi:MAG: type II toxin-antitoxin system RelB/DinJ family antitoxin [Firmicutes bacterium]|nr:type II toxin-antitoxin system RelB/DinJ family antitoxin [Bacillota bacterium]
MRGNNAVKTSNLNVRVSPVTKKRSEEVFSSLGLTLSDAINVFLLKAIREGGFPFDVREPQYNEETIEAMEEAKRIAHDPNVKGYTNLDELFAELKA